MGLIGTSRRRSSAAAVSHQMNKNVESFSEMKASLVEGIATNYTILHDEFHEVDDNVIYFNGKYLYAYGVKIDDSEQPIFN